eukprot:scaffold26989_cov59-Phaeocystis_antarctica.AAC.2
MEPATACHAACNRMRVWSRACGGAPRAASPLRAPRAPQACPRAASHSAHGCSPGRLRPGGGRSAWLASAAGRPG